MELDTITKYAVCVNEIDLMISIYGDNLVFTVSLWGQFSIYSFFWLCHDQSQNLSLVWVGCGGLRRLCVGV